MALTILSSNRVETLQSRLAEQLAADPMDPFACEIIVVPTYAMGRWLNLRIARQQGIAANISYPQMSDWVWTLANQLLDDTPQHDPYNVSSLAWQIFSLLPGSLNQKAFASLQHYLSGDDSGIKRWQLAQQIAGSFDRYQLYRPQLIRAWSDGADNHWQALLWRSLTDNLHQTHRVDVLARLIEYLADDGQTHELPARISLFAISSLAPCFIELVHALSMRTEVLLFQHSPTDQYWADLVNEKVQAQRRLQNPGHAEYFEAGNSLLASWGRQGQAMQDLLLDLGAVTAREIEDNQPPDNQSLLRCVQGSLFRLESPTKPIAIDDSISVHVCHSPMRECQVLHDHLLMLLDRHPQMVSEDILVMVPEISRYAPSIEAVFQHDPGGKRPGLSWNISDISVSDGHPLVKTFLQLLKLPASRFTRSEIMAFLECAEIRNRFAINAQMLVDIHRLVEAARVHWGFSAEHRRRLGLPAVHENTWQQAWERFFAGYALADDSLWQGIAPLTEIDAEAGVAIAQFRHLFERLVYWHERLSKPVDAHSWQTQLHQMIEEFLAPQSIAEDLLQPLRDAISELGQANSGQLTPSLVSYWMEQQLGSNQQPGRLYSGGVTFCGMQPMRNIPFPVICVLGMQDNAFPRREQQAEFDLMRHRWQPGDPRKGDQDRYLMLETLLCARQYLYFSYSGRSLKDNSECQPSVLLRELLDYIDVNFDVDRNASSVSHQISRDHPMQAFSARNFQPDSPGYDRHWFDTAIELGADHADAGTGSWSQQALPQQTETGSGVDLDRLVRFFSHPIRYFFNSRLGIMLASDDVNEDDESFALQNLDKWSLATRLVNDRLSGTESGADRLRAEGLLPHGHAADNAWLTLQSEYRDLFVQLENIGAHASTPRSIECQLDDDLRLYGEVRACYPGTGLLHFSASKSVKSRSLMTLWLNHLALCASGQLFEGEVSQLVTTTSKEYLNYAPIAPAAAAQQLANYVAFYRQGLEKPLPIFPDTSYAFASETDLDKAMDRALKIWRGGDYRNAAPGECEDEYVRLALHRYTAHPLDDPLFGDYANRIYQPPLAQRGQDD